MSAPIIWIFIPAILAIILWFIPNGRLVTILGIGLLLTLSLLAWLLPVEIPLSIGNVSIKIYSNLTILGRHLILSANDQPLLCFIYTSLCFWYVSSIIAGSSPDQISYGLIITSLLIAALAVEPFLYAALIIETAVLISIPLLKPNKIFPGRGLVRYLVFQTIAMPFILFSGWLLSGITTSTGELPLAGQAAIFLGLGFIFLLAIFPFNTWIPLLSEETNPSTMSLILWIFPTVGLLFGLYFLDTYSWIRDSNYLSSILRTAGMITIISGGIWAAFQKDLKRMIAYAMSMEIGYSLLAISINGSIGINLFFGLLVHRTIILFLWAMALSIILKKNSSATFTSVKGLGRKYPFASIIVVFSHLSFVGLPLLAGFPIHQALWEQLGKQSIYEAFWYLIATIGLLTGGIRVLSVLVTPSSEDEITSQETLTQRVFLSLGILILIMMGIFPQWVAPLLSRLPSLFNHLAG